jgi:hypothetical protein
MLDKFYTVERYDNRFTTGEVIIAEKIIVSRVIVVQSKVPNTFDSD